MLLIDQFLAPDKLAELEQMLKKVPFIDGKSTGGVHGSQIKNNRQADVRDAPTLRPTTSSCRPS